MSLAPGSYTAILSGANLTTGMAVVEVYDLDGAADSKPRQHFDARVGADW